MQSDTITRHARMLLAGDPHTPALYRLLQPCGWTDGYLKEQATRDKLWPDDQHERNRVVCKIRR